MKRIITLTALLAGLAVANAQEKVPHDEAQKIARKVTELIGTIADGQIKISPDADKAEALKASEAGMLVLPDEKLTAEAIEKAGATIVPVAQLFFKGIAPAKGGHVTPNDKLRIVTISDKDQDHKLPLCLLGARKRDGKLELVVFGNGKEPLQLLNLTKAESPAGSPIEMSGEKQGDESALITLNVLGKYKASLTVMKQEN
ncbi:MAG: hypothetical protein HY301_16385 [Verrucomicrobia bacterium]|nr:hypothetical protein [Verrucomicrobiota bacterium]